MFHFKFYCFKKLESCHKHLYVCFYPFQSLRSSVEADSGWEEFLAQQLFGLTSAF